MPTWRAREAPFRRHWDSLAAFVGYALISGLYLGLPLILHSGGRFIGDGRDPTLVIWAFAWWPHAIAHGLNPIVTHVIWAPEGVNLMWVGAVPGLALPFTPLTLVAGPVLAFNVCAILTPAFAAWTAFRLCRRLTRSLWPSLVGGFLFGCSSFELVHTELAHVGLAGAGALLPLIALVVLRFLDSEIGGRGLVVRLGPLLGLGPLFSTEIAFTTALAIAAGLVLGFILVPARRSRLLALSPYLLASYGLAALLTAPFVYYLLTGFHRETFFPPSAAVTDSVNFLEPTKRPRPGEGRLDHTLTNC